jgi:hypothetical protein
MSPIRIALWSGPRNISTAMMRAFANRPDTAVVDEPFYAAWLKESGADHPMREAILRSQPVDPEAVVAGLLGPVPGGLPVFYQKHMAHHMAPSFDLSWMAGCRNAFLIRPPEEVLASYAPRRSGAAFTMAEIGFERQAELFDREAQRLGAAPPVIEARDVLADPRAALTVLCEAVGLAFSPAMLAWPAGRRVTDGVWAPVWYDAVERSTGFTPPRSPMRLESLDQGLRPTVEAARPFYDRLATHRLVIPETQ